jgi:hypothetical protein
MSNFYKMLLKSEEKKSTLGVSPVFAKVAISFKLLETKGGFPWAN